VATRVVLVTGGSRGLGAGLVDSFLDVGDSVATCSRSPTDATGGWSSEWPERFHYEAVDLADRDACEAFVAGVLERFGQIDVLVNNAGLARERVLPFMREHDIDEVIDLNLKATIRVTRLVSRQMLRQDPGGRIINMSSVGGLTGYRGLSVYSATKAAIDGLTRSLAREFGSRGITVNSVAPGYVQTEMSYGLDEGQLEQITRRTPLGRLGEPEDVVAAVHFLASAEAGFVTGHVLVVDGGLTA
jgi:3-oxoacyl-[acyl-carrier protein] reductase